MKSGQFFGRFLYTFDVISDNLVEFTLDFWEILRFLISTCGINPDTLKETVEIAGASGEKISTHIVNIADRKANEKSMLAVFT
jgi:hypothetical protein